MSHTLQDMLKLRQELDSDAPGTIVLSKSDMLLPEGKTCSDCAHYKQCVALFDCPATNTECDWAPSRFRQRVSDGTLQGEGKKAKPSTDDRIWLRQTHEEDGWWFGYYADRPQDDAFTEYVAVTELERVRGERDELSAIIEACHAMLDKLDPEYEEGWTTLVPLDTRLKEFLWSEDRITDDMVNGDD